MPPTPDRRARNAERFAEARRRLDELERRAAVTGRVVELRPTNAGFQIALRAGRPAPKPPLTSARRG